MRKKYKEYMCKKYMTAKGMCYTNLPFRYIYLISYSCRSNYPKEVGRTLLELPYPNIYLGFRLMISS